MKIFRVLLFFLFIFCLAKSFWKNPFDNELPLLLFPEKKAWLSCDVDWQDPGYNWDDRPLCLQTSFNFSELKPLLLPQTSELLTGFKGEIIKETHNLGIKDWQLKTEQVQPKTKIRLIWPCRRIKPIKPQLRFLVEKDSQTIYGFKVLCIGNSPGKNTFYSISTKTGWTSFLYKEKAWFVVKTFIQQTNVPLGIAKIQQD